MQFFMTLKKTKNGSNFLMSNMCTLYSTKLQNPTIIASPNFLEDLTVNTKLHFLSNLLLCRNEILNLKIESALCCEF